jgi:phospholipid/cholesterol/gamma-HCH transport system substrate-binding protein
MRDAPAWFRHASRGNGALLLLAIAIFVVAVLQAGVFRDLFRQRLTLRVILPETGLAGLNVGAPVQVLGTDAGKVREIVIHPNESLYATVDLDASWEPFVRRDSRVFIRRQFGIAGAAFLEIARGSGEPLDWEFAVLSADPGDAPTESIDAMIKELRERVTPIVDDLGRTVRAAGNLVESLQAPDGALRRAVGDLATVTNRLAAGEGTVGRLLADDALADDLVRIVAALGARVAEIEAILAGVRRTTDSIAAASGTFGTQADRLPRMVDDTAAAIAALRQVMAGLDKTMPQVAGLVGDARKAAVGLPAVLVQTQQTLAELQRLLAQLQNNWLIGGGGGAPAAPERSRLSPLEVRP